MLEPDNFVKSSFSLVNCVSVRLVPGVGVQVAHSRDLNGAAIQYTNDEWAAFLSGVRAGEFDLPQ